MSLDWQAFCPRLVNLLLDTVFVVDEHGTIVFVSEACEQLLGYSAEEMTGTKVLSYLHPDDIHRTRAAAERVMSGQPHIDFENRYLHRSGRVVHILWSARWYGEDRLRIAVARDVTAQRRSEKTRDALYRISEAAHEAPTIRALCDGVRCLIAELFPGSDFYLVLKDPQSGGFWSPDWLSATGDGWTEQVLSPDTALAEIITVGGPRMAALDGRRPGAGTPAIKAPGSANWLGVPMALGERLLGALAIETTVPHLFYDRADQDLLQFVATQVATVVERKRAEDRLRHLAHHDGLTNLTNRALFHDRLETALRSANRIENQIALLFLDLDGFKEINDTRGHEAGDRILVEVARRLEDSTRETDTVARMGGDEFTVLLTNVQDRGAVETAIAKVRELLAMPIDLDGERVYVSCSIGMALYPGDGVTANELLARADTDMYAGKRPDRKVQAAAQTDGPE